MSDAFHSSQEISRCRTCGTVLNGSRFDGLCPACTWRGLSAEEPEEEFQIPSRKSQIPNPQRIRKPCFGFLVTWCSKKLPEAGWALSIERANWILSAR